MKKKILLGGIMFFSIFVPVFAVKVSLNPLYIDPRFEPSDKLHAGCVNNLNVVFQSEGQEVENIHLVFSYRPEDIQIVRVSSSADKNLVNYNIDYDTLVLNYLNQKEKKLQHVNLFQISFKSLESLTSTVFSLHTGSYVLLKNGNKLPLEGDTQLFFAQAQECEPDEIPPVISLVSPQNNKDPLPLDRYFVFDIKDVGKGVDKKSVEIDFAGEHYTFFDTQYLQRSGNYLFFYPKKRLPINTELTLQITVSDLQVYGGPNSLKKSFTFVTAPELLLLNNIQPEVYRKIVAKSNTFGSFMECKMLKQMYPSLDFTSQKILLGILKKMACDISDLSTFVQQNSNKVHADYLYTLQASKKISVLSVVGWILFSLALLLKLHYYISYRRHKKLSGTLQEKFSV